MVFPLLPHAARTEFSFSATSRRPLSPLDVCQVQGCVHRELGTVPPLVSKFIRKDLVEKVKTTWGIVARKTPNYREMEAGEPTSADGEVQQSRRPAALSPAAFSSDAGGAGRTPTAAGRTSRLPPARTIVAFPKLTQAPLQKPTRAPASEGPVSRLKPAADTQVRSRGCDRSPSMDTLGAVRVCTHLTDLPVSATALSPGLTACSHGHASDALTTVCLSMLTPLVVQRQLIWTSYSLKTILEN